jgi:hypothetical protein
MTLREVQQRFAPEQNTVAKFKAWLLESEKRPEAYFENRVVNKRTIVSSRLFGWNRGYEALKALDNLIAQQLTLPDGTEISGQAALLRDLLVPGVGVDMTDDPSIPDQLIGALSIVGFTVTPDEAAKLKAYGWNDLPRYRRYAPNGEMPTDEQIAMAL